MNTQFPTSHHITSHHITSHCDDIGRFLGRHRSFLAVLAVFDGCWSLFGSIFAKNVRFSLVFTRDSCPPGTLHRFYSFLLLSAVSDVRPGRIDPGFPAPGSRMTVVCHKLPQIKQPKESGRKKWPDKTRPKNNQKWQEKINIFVAKVLFFIKFS